MSTLSWTGDAPAIAQVDTITVGGTWATNDLAKITINGNVVQFTVGATTTIAAVCAGLAAAWNASTVKEAMEITAAAGATTVTLTADAAGKPFTATVSKTSTSGTISTTTTVANGSPNDWANASNWSSGSVPANGDTVILENSKIDILYGLDQHAVTLAALNIAQSFTGTIGLPRTNSSGYVEYRPQYLQIGATLCTIGRGDGQGSGRIKIDFYSIQTTCTIQNSGSAAESGVPSILLKGTHASNVLNLVKGSVGVAFFAGESATIATVNVGYYANVNGDSTLIMGSGVSLTTIKQSGGSVVAESNVTTLTQYGGAFTMRGAATIATATIEGTLFDESTGTFTTLTILGKYDRRHSMAAKTCINISLYKGAEWHDPFKCVSYYNPINLAECSLEDVTLDIAPNCSLMIY